MYLFIDIIDDILQGILCHRLFHRHLHFRQWLLHCLSDIPSYKTIRIYMAFQIKQKANTHPHALPVFFFTINIP